MIASLVAPFAEVEDPRYDGFGRYPQPEIVLGALVETLCGAEDWQEIGLFCEEKREVSRRFLRDENGIVWQKHSGACSTFWTASVRSLFASLGEESDWNRYGGRRHCRQNHARRAAGRRR